MRHQDRKRHTCKQLTRGAAKHELAQPGMTVASYHHEIGLRPLAACEMGIANVPAVGSGDLAVTGDAVGPAQDRWSTSTVRWQRRARFMVCMTIRNVVPTRARKDNPDCCGAALAEAKHFDVAELEGVPDTILFGV
jgi:hypothetical protein